MIRPEAIPGFPLAIAGLGAIVALLLTNPAVSAGHRSILTLRLTSVGMTPLSEE